MKIFQDEEKHLSNWTPQYPLASSSLREVKIVRSRQLTKEGSHKTAFEITLDLAVSLEFKIPSPELDFSII